MTIRVSDEYMRQIEEIARKMGLKKSDVARMAIKEFIDHHAGPENGHPYAEAKSLLGVAESGIKDLGQNHRQQILKNIKKRS